VVKVGNQYWPGRPPHRCAPVAGGDRERVADPALLQFRTWCGLWSYTSSPATHFAWAPAVGA